MLFHPPSAVHHPPLRLAVCLALLAVCGCGDGDSLPLAPVHGTVTYKGKLLDHGTVVFMPEPGTHGPPATGDIQPDGSYKLKTLSRVGASLGLHCVMVHCCRLPTAAEKHNPGAVLESLIPIQYSLNDKSPLRYEVKQEPNEYHIELE